MIIFRCSFLLSGLLALSACDTDIYQNTSACRDGDANTVCPVDGSQESSVEIESAANVVKAESPLSIDDRLALASMAAIGIKGSQTKIVDGEEVTITPLQIIDLPFGPVLLASREIKYGCHACTGEIGAYYLEQKGRQFVVKARYPEALKGWGWGAAPEFSITDRFTPYPALYSEGGGGGQGYFCTGSNLVELTPSGPVESDLINTGYSDSGAIVDKERAAREIEGKIVNIRRAKSFDVVARGSERFVEHYVFKGGKFVRTVAESRLQC